MRGAPKIPTGMPKGIKISKVKSGLPKLGGIRVKTGIPRIKGLKKY